MAALSDFFDRLRAPSASRGAPVFAARQAEGANLAMLLQFYSSLSARFQLMSGRHDAGSAAEAERRIADILAPIDDPRAEAAEFSWRAAYIAETLMTALMRDEEIRAEVAERLEDRRVQADAAGMALCLQCREALDPPAPDLGRARALLRQAVVADQWRRSVRVEIDRLAGRYRLRLNQAFLLTLFLFLSVLFIRPDSVADQVGLDLLAVTRDSGGGYSGLLTAILAGLMGGSFSTLVFSKTIAARSIEEMQAISSKVQILMRLLVGGGGASILYFFFETGLITGVAIPNLDTLAFAKVSLGVDAGPAPDPAQKFGIYVPNKDVSLLMIWSFLAGFSESLVPQMLTRVETASGGPPSQGPLPSPPPRAPSAPPTPDAPDPAREARTDEDPAPRRPTPPRAADAPATPGDETGSEALPRASDAALDASTIPRAPRPRG
ncbi:hypothetical protein [uncultured Albimonas sp.]|uniref:hypothetical protein n=1 Tax=uncultured Albimonas sp. TaxID=1331701 RepID=UPI0030EF2156